MRDGFNVFFLNVPKFPLHSDRKLLKLLFSDHCGEITDQITNIRIEFSDRSDSLVLHSRSPAVITLLTGVPPHLLRHLPQHLQTHT